MVTTQPWRSHCSRQGTGTYQTQWRPSLHYHHHCSTHHPLHRRVWIHQGGTLQGPGSLTCHHRVHCMCHHQHRQSLWACKQNRRLYLLQLGLHHLECKRIIDNYSENGVNFDTVRILVKTYLILNKNVWTLSRGQPPPPLNGDVWDFTGDSPHWMGMCDTSHVWTRVKRGSPPWMGIPVLHIYEWEIHRSTLLSSTYELHKERDKLTTWRTN